MTRWGSTRRGRFAFSWDVTAFNRPKVWTDWTDEKTWTVAVSWGDGNSDALSAYVDLRLPQEGLQTLVRRWTTLADFPDRLTVGPPLTFAQMGRIVGKTMVKALAPIANLFQAPQLQEAVRGAAAVEDWRLEAKRLGIPTEDAAEVVARAVKRARESTMPFLRALAIETQVVRVHWNVQ